MSERNKSRRQSMLVAFCGMMVALSVVLMLTGGLIPIMTYVSPLAAGLLLLPVMVEYGKKYAWTAFAATALIVLILGVDKEAAFFYLFLGYYPVLKWDIDRIKNRSVCILVKLALFSLACVGMYALMAFVLHMEAVVADFNEMGTLMTVAFFVMMIFCMMIYDRLLAPMTILYVRKLKPKLKMIR